MKQEKSEIYNYYFDDVATLAYNVTNKFKLIIKNVPALRKIINPKEHIFSMNITSAYLNKTAEICYDINFHKLSLPEGEKEIEYKDFLNFNIIDFDKL